MALLESQGMVGKEAYMDMGIIVPGSGKPSLVMFICNHCPFVKERMEAISAITREYKDIVNIICINSNDHPEDTPELMVPFRDDWDLGCKYLFDKDQHIARAYGAVCTPEFYVIDRDGIIVYHGELDPSNRENGLTPTGSSLRHALELTIANRPIDWTITPSFGCSIKWSE